MAKKTKLYEIQSDVPLPFRIGEGRGRWIELLKSMTSSQSILLKNRDEYAAFHKAATSLKIKVVSRTEGEFIRVWILPNKVKPDAVKK